MQKTYDFIKQNYHGTYFTATADKDATAHFDSFVKEQEIKKL